MTVPDVNHKLSLSKEDAGGFSLIELLIASSLLLIVILGTGQLMLLSWSFKMRTDAGTAAAELASSRIENLRPALAGNGGFDQEGSEIQGSSLSSQSFSLNWSAREDPSGLRVLEIHCLPLDFPAKQTAVLIYISPGLGF
jgi:prepilin-type N-terminal cleavage/methylation domain-containing protein